jgi:hypothetical protein
MCLPGATYMFSRGFIFFYFLLRGSDVAFMFPPTAHALHWIQTTFLFLKNTGALPFYDNSVPRYGVHSCSLSKHRK